MNILVNVTPRLKACDKSVSAGTDADADTDVATGTDNTVVSGVDAL